MILPLPHQHLAKLKLPPTNHPWFGMLGQKWLGEGDVVVVEGSRFFMVVRWGVATEGGVKAEEMKGMVEVEVTGGVSAVVAVSWRRCRRCGVLRGVFDGCWRRKGFVNVCLRGATGVTGTWWLECCRLKERRWNWQQWECVAFAGERVFGEELRKKRNLF